MRGEHAQGTVEYVGILLVVSVLLGALVTAFGIPSSTTRLASSFTRAIVGAFGLSQTNGGGHAAPSAEDRALYARATDAGVASDDRPSLRDVRLRLIAERGDADGRRVYRTLVLDGLRGVVPAFGRPELLGSAVAHPAGIDSAITRAIAEARALSPPVGDDRGELETPVGRPNAHVVTTDEQDAGYTRVLHPGISFRSVALDTVSSIPGPSTVLGLGRIAITSAKLLARLSTIVSDVGDIADLGHSLSPTAKAIPPGARAGDVVVSWSATRRSLSDGSTHQVERAAVVRDGVLLTTVISVLDPASP